MRQMPERVCKDHVTLAAIPRALKPYAIRKSLRPGDAAERMRTSRNLLSRRARRQIDHARLHHTLDARLAPPCMHDETLFGEYAQGFPGFTFHRAIEHDVQSTGHTLTGNAPLLRSRLAPPRQTARIALLNHGKQRFPIAAQQGILQRWHLLSRHRLRIPEQIRTQHGQPPARETRHRRNP